MLVGHQKKLALIFMGLIALLQLLITPYLPIQTDEVTWMMLNARTLLDRGELITLTPQCGQLSFKAPLLWTIPALINGAIYTPVDGPATLRLYGVGAFWLFILSFSLIVAALYPGKSNILLSIFVVIIALSVDPQLFAMQLIRPEMQILVCTGIFIATALHTKQRKIFVKLFALILMLFVANYMHMIHPKSILYLPLELACVWYIIYKDKYGRYIFSLFAVLLIINGVLATAEWSARSVCNGSALVQKNMRQLGLTPASVDYNVIRLFLGLIVNMIFGTMMDLGINHSFALKPYEWLPYSVSEFPAAAIWISLLLGIGVFLLRLSLLLYIVYVSVKYLSKFFKKTANCNSVCKDRSECYPMIFTLLFVIASQAAILGPNKLFYHSIAQVGLLIFIMPLVLFITHESLLKTLKSKKKLLGLLIMLAMVSQALMLSRYLPIALHPEQQQYGIKDRIITTAVGGFKEKNEAIKSILSQCSMGQTDKLKHIVIDDYTYYSLRRSFEPLHIHYITNIYMQDISKSFDVVKFLNMLSNYGSDGLILDCDNVVPQLKPYVIEKNGFCCLSKGVINSVVGKTQ